MILRLDVWPHDNKSSFTLQIAHMSRTEMELLDTSLLGPGLLFLNQYFDTWLNEHLVLWICFVSKFGIVLRHCYSLVMLEF